MDIGGLTQKMKEIPDPRRAWGNLRHKLEDIFVIGLATARQMYERIRGHWSIENRLHWSLDVVFGEDACGVTKEHGPENLNTLRKLALSLLRAAPSPRSGKKKITGPKRQFIAAMNPDYLFTVLFEK